MQPEQPAADDAQHEDCDKSLPDNSLKDNHSLGDDLSTKSGIQDMESDSSSKPMRSRRYGDGSVNVPNADDETKMSTLIDRFLDGTACGRRLDKANCCGSRGQNLDDESQSILPLEDGDTLRDFMFDDDTFPTDDDDTYRDGDTLETMDDTLEDINMAVFILKRHATRLGVSESELLKKIEEEQARRQKERADPTIGDFDSEA